MATAAVVATTTNSRVNDSDSNTGWGNYGSGGGAPASEAQLAYLGTAVNTKTQATAMDGIDYNHGSVTDMTSATRKLWMVKVIVGDSFDTNTTEGVRVAIGSGDQTDMREFNVAGSGHNALTPVYAEYPAQGGYIITAINPDANTVWQEVAETGTPSWANVDWWGVQCAMVVGAAKNENLACDSIDIGSGLELHAGDGGSTVADMDVLVVADQGSPGTPGTRWGYVVTKAGIIFVHGMMEVGRSGGSAAITEFTDNANIVVFPDAYYDLGDCGFIFDLGNASTIMTVGMTIIGRGATNGTEDTRPDHTVVGTSGAYTFTGVLTNHRNVTFTSVCDVSGAIECQLLAQASADIANAVIRTTSITNVGCLQDPTFASSTDLHDCEFVQAGAGHAIEIDTAGTYAFTNLTFTGYNASDGQSDSAIHTSHSTGEVTINVGGGNTPSVRNTGGGTYVVNNTVTVGVTVRDAKTLAVIDGARVFITPNDDTDDLPFENVVTEINRVSSIATVTHTAHGMPTGSKVLIEDAVQTEYNGIFTISNVVTNAYDYTVSGTPATPATGTILSTAVLLDTTTNGSGVAENTGFDFTNPQDVTGVARKGTTSPLYKGGTITGQVVADTGFNQTVLLVADE